MDFQTLVSGTGGATSNGGCSCVTSNGNGGCSCGPIETGLIPYVPPPVAPTPTADPLGAYVQYGTQMLDILSGGPKQREREAKAVRDAALAAERTAIAQLAAAREARAAADAAASASPSYSAPPSLALGSVGGGGGLRAMVPGLGVPVWQLLLAAGVTAGVVLWPR